MPWRISEWRRGFDGVPCPYCGIPMKVRPHRTHGHVPECYPTRDHVIPKHRGGNGVLVVCWRCNNDKAGFTLQMWLALLTFRKDPRAPIVRRVVEANPGYQERKDV